MPFVIVEYQRKIENFWAMETFVLGLTAELIREMADYEPIPHFPGIPPSHANWKPGCTKFNHCPTVILNALQDRGFKMVSTNVEFDTNRQDKHYVWTMSSGPANVSKDIPQAYSTKVNDFEWPISE